MRSNGTPPVLRPTPPLISRFLLVPCLLLLAAIPTKAQTYNVLYAFTGPTADAAAPVSLLPGDGTLYGVSCYGGQSYHGAAFTFSPAGKETILYNFLGGYGSCPTSLLAWNGELYGDTASGGSHGGGTIFKLDKNGNEVVLYNFPGPSQTSSALDFGDGNGNFYGSSGYGGSFAYGTVFKVDSKGNHSVLHSFSKGGYGGYNPGSLVHDKDGNIYGVTGFGGDTSCNCGALFKLTPLGVFTVLHVFTGGTDGAYPGGMALDEQGNLFGTASTGGITNANCRSGCGTVYEFTTSGQYKILYSFAGAPDGLGPFAIVRDVTGNLYGITSDGGDTSCYSYHNGAIGCGVLFKLDSTGTETILHSFAAAPDGAYPQSLTVDPSGVLYGVTFTGGDASCNMWNVWTGCGTIFELTP